MTPGHVFVVRSDLTRLACDAWLLPTDRSLTIEQTWIDQLQTLGVLGANRPEPPQAFEPALRTGRWLTTAEGTDIWATDVGGSAATDPAWFIDGAEAFVTAAARLARDRQPLNKRALPLLALPVVGTGAGGGAQAFGQVLEQLLPRLHDLARSEGVDIVLVTREAAAFAAAQELRSTWPDEQWPLDAHELAEADRLGRLARSGRLVLFLGAGVSIGAGLPTWAELLDELAERPSISDAERAALQEIPPLDRAQLLAGRLQSDDATLGQVIARRLTGSGFSLAQAQLAALPVNEVATTNYDDRFEQAAHEADRPVRVLPYDPGANTDRWLLKLHGCVTHPEDIVLTRADYLRYADRRGALAGIVQAMLITRHMLFIGFSLADENFHQIVDEVRKALDVQSASTQRDPFGTALLLDADPLVQELWQGDLACDTFGAHGDTLAMAARQLEVFMDRLALCAVDHSTHLLDDRFSSLLNPSEVRLKELLGELQQELARHDTSPAWTPIRDLLKRFGSPRVQE